MSKPRTGVRKALSLTFVRTGVALVFNVASVTIVSRLLTPAEVGVFSVATAFVTLAHMLRNFGVSDLIIQEKTLSEDVIRTAFTMNVVIAWSLGLLLFGCSGLIGRFYGDPGVAHVTRVLSLLFALMPFGTTPLARMKRNMQFSLLVRIQVLEVSVRSISTVVLAYLGFSYMSMAWGSVAAMTVVVIGTAIWGAGYGARGFGFKEWRRVLHFGSNRAITDIVGQLGSQSANIVVGRMLGMEAAGFLSRGYGIVRIFNARIVSAVSQVAYPAYAREHREGNAAPLLFKKSLVYLSALNWPFFAFCTLMAHPLIRIAFGNQWDPAVPVMRWLCVAAMASTLIKQCNQVLTAMGRYREVTRVEIQYQVFRIGLVIVAALHSLEAVAASQVLVYAVAAVLYYRKFLQYDALKPRALMSALAPSAVLTIASSVAPVAVLVLWPGPMSDHYLPGFFVAAAGTGATWLAGVFLLKHPLSLEITSALSLLRARIRRVPKPG
jgi:O-antigen/teichoic acid export membrane protein